MNELVSVIVPIYKVEEYLDRCIESIVGQTYQNIEILLVDDGSPDNCPAMCDAWAERDSRITVIHKENGGLSDARNAAIDVAKGDYITFVDSDDLITVNAIEVLMELANIENSDVVISTKLLKFSEEISVDCTQCESYKTVSAQTALESIFCENTRWEACGTIFSHHLFETTRFPVGKIYEDIRTIPGVIFNAKTVTFADVVIYYYFERLDSIMHQSGHIVKIDLYEAVKENIELFETIEDKKRRTNVIAGILEELVSRIHFAYGNEAQNKEFIEKSKHLVRARKKDIVSATKIPFKRKLFMFLVMCGISKKIKKWE
ncbi:MAG: glycosyltransferase family 2 protein [Clostridia bacterium]|nr:glycosyltransferase family 2 protein [Clostridia bacterium]